jgi:hypothetical protein
MGNVASHMEPGVNKSLLVAVQHIKRRCRREEGENGDLVVAIYWLSWTYRDTVASRTRNFGSKV